ncbi:hypothetical protein FOT57_23435 [Serratia ureilytica]|uniref:hypothetical protein n=1 Tax=Serratia ureilytica TaxID=300181 RepID=UPI0011C79A0C|nr:hypothetical protein [Serratia ureilytica]TXE51169.1 hypothetical protein FOT57_23435 [Serratia ureilytica]
MHNQSLIKLSPISTEVEIPSGQQVVSKTFHAPPLSLDGRIKLLISAPDSPVLPACQATAGMVVKAMHHTDKFIAGSKTVHTNCDKIK